MDAKILELNQRLIPARQAVAKLEAAIRALQDICTHKWVGISSGSHEDCYECEYCGLKDFRDN